MTTEISEAVCGNCGAVLAGKYCGSCGQKRVTDRDRGLGHLLGEAFRTVTELDGKLLRSLRLLMFRPGMLSREYMDDRRVRYTAPISLFLLANVLYFFAPAMSDFNLPFEDQVPGAIATQVFDPAAPGYAERLRREAHYSGQVHSRWTASFVPRKLAQRQAREPGYDMRALARDYDVQAGTVGKALIIVHVPLIALALALVYVGRRRYFAEHSVVALHVFTFLLLFGQLVVAPLNWLGTHWFTQVPGALDKAIGWSLLGTVFAYILFACRNAYRCGWGAAVVGLFAVLLGLYFGNLWLYRAMQFVIALALV